MAPKSPERRRPTISCTSFIATCMLPPTNRTLCAAQAATCALSRVAGAHHTGRGAQGEGGKRVGVTDEHTISSQSASGPPIGFST
jgi:hypothetical protein